MYSNYSRFFWYFLWIEGANGGSPWARENESLCILTGLEGDKKHNGRYLYNFSNSLNNSSFGKPRWYEDPIASVVISVFVVYRFTIFRNGHWARGWFRVITYFIRPFKQTFRDFRVISLVIPTGELSAGIFLKSVRCFCSSDYRSHSCYF